ncbi:MAG TPA: translation initiation factor IF-2 [Candidatus Blautia intestinigallinarum]|nr:translation initiation factor IF-2 [Candidatus Blautia intestinigallinarum]
MAKIRVHEMARELGMTNREVMDTLKSLGIDVKSHMSSVEDTLAKRVREKYEIIRKEQKVEAPNNEKNVNKQEETPKKKKNIIRVYHAQNASDGGKRKQGERRRGDRRPGQGRNQNSNRPSSQAPRNQEERASENQEMNAKGNTGAGQQNGGAPRNNNRSYQDRQGGRGDGQDRQERRTDNRDGQGRSQGRGGRSYQDRQGGRGDGQDRQERRTDNRDGQGRSQGRGGRSYQDRQGGRGDGRDNRENQGRFQGRGGRQSRQQDSDAVFVAEMTKPSKEGKRERDNKRDNKKKDYEKSSRRPNQGGKRPNMRLPKALQKPTPQQKQEEKKPEVKEITLPEKLTIRELAEKMKMQPSVIVKKLFMEGIMVTVNHEIDFEKAQEIALDYDIIAEQEEKVDVIGELLKEEEEDESLLQPRPPVVCVMGHVDHGKTSLLDAIRNTHVTDKEAGGITQHIGAYVVQINGQKITFLDTPGHEAFTAMRMRGANATDIAILVVAADDGVMPQTVEAISHAKAAGIEIIVAINKIDKPSANVERVKQELSEYELIPEDWGGSTIFVPVSAHTGEGIDNLLEMILLTAEVCELKANPNRAARGMVIEAELDKGKGPVATILVQKGTLHVGDFIAAGASSGKVRAMMDDKGRRVKEAGPSTPVEILGLSDVPNAGEILVSFDSDKEAKHFASTFVSENKNRLLEDTKAKLSLDDLFSQIQAGNLKELPIIVKADVQGSVEAVKQSLTKLSNDEVVVKVIHGGVGAINESDVTLAATSNAIVIGFNVRPDAMAKQLAEQEGVDLRLYRVIYQAIEDVEAAMKGMLDPIYEEKVIGHAEVRQLFKASGVGTIAGSYVLDGVFQRACKIRISREGEQIYEGALASLKRFKDDVKEVKAGYECGLVFEDFNDIKEEDQVEAYIMVEVPR